MCFGRFGFHLIFPAVLPRFEAEKRLKNHRTLETLSPEFHKIFNPLSLSIVRRTESGTLSRLENLVLTVFITYVVRNFTSSESHYMFQVNLLIPGNDRIFN